MSVTTAPQARATWPRATATIDGVTYKQARFVLRDGRARLFDGNGNLLHEGEVADLALQNRTAALTTLDGVTWAVDKPGCGCGGR